MPYSGANGLFPTLRRHHNLSLRRMRSSRSIVSQTRRSATLDRARNVPNTNINS